MARASTGLHFAVQPGVQGFTSLAARVLPLGIGGKVWRE